MQFWKFGNILVNGFLGGLKHHWNVGRAEGSSAIWLHNLAWRSEFFCCSGLLNPYDWFLPPTKLVPLSHTTSSGKPRRDAIRKNAFRNESVSRLNATSRCTALVAKHVNRQRYPFWRVLPLPCLVIKGPLKSTDVWLKARKDFRVRNSGKGAIICLAEVAFLLRHCKHSFSHSLIVSLAEIIQYWTDCWANTWLVPACWVCSWACFIMRVETHWLRGRMMG